MALLLGLAGRSVAVSVAGGVVVGFPLLTAYALRRVHAAHTLVFIGILPLMTSLFGVLRAGEHPRPLFWPFALLGSLAVALYAWIHAGQGFAAAEGIGPERFEVKGLVKLCDMLDGRRSVSELVELAPERTERLRIGRMLCLLEACDLARPA